MRSSTFDYGNLNGNFTNDTTVRGFGIDYEELDRLGLYIEQLVVEHDMLAHRLDSSKGRRFLSDELYPALQMSYPLLFPRDCTSPYGTWVKAALKALVTRRKNNANRRSIHVRKTAKTASLPSSIHTGPPLPDETFSLNESSPCGRAASAGFQDERKCQLGNGNVARETSGNARPFARINISVEREGSSQKALCRTGDLCADSKQLTQELTANDLEWLRFEIWLEENLSYRAGVDSVVYTDNGDEFMIKDDSSWKAAMEEMFAEGARRLRFYIKRCRMEAGERLGAHTNGGSSYNVRPPRKGSPARQVVSTVLEKGQRQSYLDSRRTTHAVREVRLRARRRSKTSATE